MPITITLLDLYTCNIVAAMARVCRQPRKDYPLFGFFCFVFLYLLELVGGRLFRCIHYQALPAFRFLLFLFSFRL
jgi:hypothetical protein